MNEGDILAMIARASEFEQLKVRDDEMDELDDLTHEWCQVSLDTTQKSSKSVLTKGPSINYIYNSCRKNGKYLPIVNKNYGNGVTSGVYISIYSVIFIKE